MASHVMDEHPEHGDMLGTAGSYVVVANHAAKVEASSELQFSLLLASCLVCAVQIDYRLLVARQKWYSISWYGMVVWCACMTCSNVLGDWHRKLWKPQHC